MPALLALIPGLIQGASGQAGTQSVFQLAAMRQAAEKAEANQRMAVYIGGGVLAAFVIGGLLYYTMKE